MKRVRLSVAVLALMAGTASQAQSEVTVKSGTSQEKMNYTSVLKMDFTKSVTLTTDGGTKTMDGSKAFSMVFPIPVRPVGDANNDGKVELADVEALVSTLLGKRTDKTGTADVNKSGAVSVGDLTKLIQLLGAQKK